MNIRQQRTALAEELVARAMVHQGWRILARNFRHTGFELDIVAMKATTLVTVEVKYRRYLDTHVFEALLPRRKFDALRRGLTRYAYRQSLAAKTLRVDLALVLQEAPNRPPILRYWPAITREACK